MTPPCPYCFSASDRASFAGREIEHARWLDLLLAVPGGPHRFYFSYGESVQPFMAPLYRGLIAAGHRVTMSSNAMASAQELEVFADIAPSIPLALSWHPHGLDLDEFIERRQRLLDMGWQCGLSMLVSYPPYIASIPEWVREYEARTGHRMSVLAFAGPYGGCQYPAAYTDEERAVIYAKSNPHYEQANWNANSPKGLRCYVGVRYILIRPDGCVLACPYDHSAIGNIVEGIAWPTEPVVCAQDRCGCQTMWQYIEEEAVSCATCRGR